MLSPGALSLSLLPLSLSRRVKKPRREIMRRRNAREGDARGTEGRNDDERVGMKRASTAISSRERAETSPRRAIDSTARERKAKR